MLKPVKNLYFHASYRIEKILFINLIFIRHFQFRRVLNELISSLNAKLTEDTKLNYLFFNLTLTYCLIKIPGLCMQHSGTKEIILTM